MDPSSFVAVTAAPSRVASDLDVAVRLNVPVKRCSGVPSATPRQYSLDASSAMSCEMYTKHSIRVLVFIAIDRLVDVSSGKRILSSQERFGFVDFRLLRFGSG